MIGQFSGLYVTSQPAKLKKFVEFNSSPLFEPGEIINISPRFTLFFSLGLMSQARRARGMNPSGKNEVP